MLLADDIESFWLAGPSSSGSSDQAATTTQLDRTYSHGSSALSRSASVAHSVGRHPTVSEGQPMPCDTNYWLDRKQRAIYHHAKQHNAVPCHAVLCNARQCNSAQYPAIFWIRCSPGLPCRLLAQIHQQHYTMASHANAKANSIPAIIRIHCAAVPGAITPGAATATPSPVYMHCVCLAAQSASAGSQLQPGSSPMCRCCSRN